MSRASSLADTRICPCQSARGGINYSNQRVLPAQLEICGRGARTRIPRISLSPYVGPKWKDRLARLAVKTSTLVPCVDAYAKSASSVHSQRHPCALTVVHHFWLDGWCRWKEREREREGEGGRWKRNGARPLCIIYGLWIWRLKRGKKERKEERKIESRKIEIWWKDLDWEITCTNF